MALVQANTGFIRQYHGDDLQVQQGDVFDADHEIVRSTPAEWWTPLVQRFSGPEEAVSTRKRTAPTKRDVAADD